MTKQELDELIRYHAYLPGDVAEAEKTIESIKRLFRDVIEAVKPERWSSSDQREGLADEKWDRWNRCIDQLEANVKELLG